jgi:hypothetical protein
VEHRLFSKINPIIQMWGFVGPSAQRDVTSA